jgi:hypothetical protein
MTVAVIMPINETLFSNAGTHGLLFPSCPLMNTMDNLLLKKLFCLINLNCSGYSFNNNVMDLTEVG